MKLLILTALIVLPALQTASSQVKVVDSNTVQMDKESLRRMIIMLIERESLLETVKARDMEVQNLEDQSFLKEKENKILKNSLEMILKEGKPWGDNFLTGMLAGTLLTILLQIFSR